MKRENQSYKSEHIKCYNLSNYYDIDHNNFFSLGCVDYMD